MYKLIQAGPLLNCRTTKLKLSTHTINNPCRVGYKKILHFRTSTRKKSEINLDTRKPAGSNCTSPPASIHRHPNYLCQANAVYTAPLAETLISNPPDQTEFGLPYPSALASPRWRFVGRRTPPSSRPVDRVLEVVRNRNETRVKSSSTTRKEETSYD
jgi:hypothetical protein